VYFDTPDPSRTAHFVIDGRPLTPEEYKARCTHIPPENNGLVTAPAADVSTHQTGTGAENRLAGGRESDTLRGLAGNDLMGGGAGNDTLYGDRGNDILSGGPGADTLEGGPGADSISDRRGPTVVRTGTRTGRGRDRVNVRDGRGDDTVNCGSDRSTAIVDSRDRVIGHCGKVVRSGSILRSPQ